uniref:Uncharacterized protein n=1 Tax=Oryza barthii TaxID=65489 RepID=A0A0D3HSV7_9ORYZ
MAGRIWGSGSRHRGMKVAAVDDVAARELETAVGGDCGCRRRQVTVAVGGEAAAAMVTIVAAAEAAAVGGFRAKASLGFFEPRQTVTARWSVMLSGGRFGVSLLPVLCVGVVSVWVVVYFFLFPGYDPSVL